MIIKDNMLYSIFQRKENELLFKKWKCLNSLNYLNLYHIKNARGVCGILHFG